MDVLKFKDFFKYLHPFIFSLDINCTMLLNMNLHNKLKRYLEQN